MLRLLLCASIAGASIYIGYYLTQRMIKRRRILEAFIRAFEEASDRIAYTSDSLADVFNSTGTDFAFSNNSPFADQWKEMLLTYKSVLKTEDIEVLSDFSQGVGTLDEAGEKNRILLYKSLFHTD